MIYLQLLDVITTKIESDIVALREGNNLFKNHYPDTPNTLVSAIHSGGFPPNKYSPTRELTFDIKIRAMNYHDGIDLGNKISNIFHSKENYQLGSFFILHSYCLSELSYLFADSQHRDEFSIDLAFLIKK